MPYYHIYIHYKQEGKDRLDYPNDANFTHEEVKEIVRKYENGKDFLLGGYTIHSDPCHLKRLEIFKTSNRLSLPIDWNNMLRIAEMVTKSFTSMPPGGICEDHTKKRDEGVQHDVFVAYYSGTGKNFARYLRKLLTRDFGFRVFLDKEDIPKSVKHESDEWRRLIDEAILNSKVFAFIMTEGFNNSKEVLRELKFAIDHKIERIHLKHEALDDNDLVINIDGKDKDLSKFQYEQFYNESGLLGKVAKILKSKASSKAEPKRRVKRGLEGKLEPSEEELMKWLTTHHNQLVEEVYEKWFDRSSQSFLEMGVRIRYSISLASVCYSDGKITITGLKEPYCQNKRMLEEAIEHLKYYSEIWYLWSNAKTRTKKALDNVRTLWKSLVKQLNGKLSVECPYLVEFHGDGVKPNHCFSPRITFSYLWSYVKSGQRPTDLVVTREGNYFRVIDLARSLNKKRMEQFLQVIIKLAMDASNQKKMKNIADQKSEIEADLEKFDASLKDIVDDVKRRHSQLKGCCQTCRSWLAKLDLPIS